MEATATQVQLSRSLPAPPGEVFAACTQREALARWFAPNDEMYAHIDQLDVRVGGRYRIEMRHQGGNVHTVTGTYKVVEAPHRLVFTWNWEGGDMAAMGESLVIIEIEAEGGGSRLRLTHEGFPSDQAATEHQKGWAGCLMRLRETLRRSTVHHVSTLLALHTRLLANVVDGVSPEHLTTRLNGHTNHMLWIVGHLAHNRATVAQTLGQEVVSPLGIFGKAIDDEADYPDLADIQAFLRTVSAAIRTRLPAVNPEELAAAHALPFEIPLNDQSVGGLLDFLLSHEAYHIGQLGFLRKALGYDAMSYAHAIEEAAPYAGRFTWYDLATTDPEGAISFYEAVVGWGTEVWLGDGQMPPYTMFTNAGTALGGVVKLPDEAEEGTPPHWFAHVGSADVDATVARAVELGGEVVKPPEDIPTVGRYAVLADPLGAVFGVFSPLQEAPGHDGLRQVGEVSWHELATSDPQEALAFYGELFGWEKAGEHDMGEDLGGIYTMIGRRGIPIGGVYAKPDDMPVSAWTYYVRVPDLERAAEAVKANGGRVVHGPMEVPGGDVIAHCLDPQGALFALHAQAEQP